MLHDGVEANSLLPADGQLPQLQDRAGRDSAGYVVTAGDMRRDRAECDKLCDKV